ncbi:Protein of unknown function [Pedococcus dokdonensis]|uniref:DUF4232 domain-containing protein n=1 Tax=Pedococcus dokdonensis TaxID=443156 RepID=A0A1H0TDT0_9MICO|nr:Protein of unknown function [Pedococcus dokdonensis]
MGRGVLRWAPTAAVLAGLLGLLVVGWRYAQYVPVFGDDVCRSRGFCDERAIALTRRELSWWYLASAVLAVVGIVVTAIRRSWRRRNLPDYVPTLGVARHTGMAALLTFAGLGWFVATFVFWLFGGAPLVLAVSACWLVGLAWGLDRLHRRAAPGESTGATLLVSSAAAVTGAALALSAFALVYQLGGKGQLVLPPLGALLGVLAVVALARVPRSGTTLAVGAAVVAVLVGAGVMASFDAGRDSVRSLRDAFHPWVPTAAEVAESANPQPPPGEGPRPPGVPAPSPTTKRTPVVKASRPCGPTDLTLQATGWDAAMGDTSVTIVATNQSSTACWVQGHPSLRLLQGGVDLHLEVGTPKTSAYGEPLRAQRVGVAPGGDALFGWWWKGYRNAADQETPQTVVLDLGRGAPLRLELPRDPHLVDVVDGAKVDVTPWGPRVD